MIGAVVMRSPISENEYLNSSYEPDCEFVEGSLVERNAGDREHSLLMGVVAAQLYIHRRAFGYRVLIACRTRVQGGR